MYNVLLLYCYTCTCISILYSTYNLSMSIIHYYLYYCIVFPSLIDKVTFPDLSIRHGALYCVSEILYSLYCIDRERGIKLVCGLGGGGHV